MVQISERYRKESARDYALRTITQNIISLELAPGSMVSENELSSILGISRTPIREALIELGKSQIVEILPQKGSRISLIDYNYVEESRFLRLVLEKAIIELACNLADDLDYSRIGENLKLQELCVQHSMSARLLELDNEFHSELFRLCSKSQTFQLMNSMTTHFDRVRSMSLTVIDEMQIVRDHKNIIKAVRDKEHAIAKELMSNHLSRYKIDEAAIRRKYPSYFK